MAESSNDIDAESSSGLPASGTVQIDTLLKRGTAALETGDLPEALRVIDRAWRHSPDNFLIGQLLARLLVACGQDRTALRHLHKLAELWPLADTEAGLAETMLRLGQGQEAFDQLSRTLSRFAVVPASPLAHAAGKILATQPAEIRGWVGLGPELELVGELKGIPAGLRPIEVYADGKPVYHDVLFMSAEGERTFRLAMPIPSRSAALSVRVDGIPLWEGLNYPPDFMLDGRATVEDERIKGWASVGWLSDRPIELVVADGRGGEAQLVSECDPALPFRVKFDFEPQAYGLRGNEIVISALLPDGTRAPLPDAPLLRSISPDSRPRRKKQRSSSPPRTSAETGLIDVVVPVFRGRKETLECLDAVIATAQNQVELVVVDDGSPEPELAAELDRLAQRGLITLLRNETNQGFPAACNRGLVLHEDRDVVLLNADTVVHDDWLARLRRAAYSAGDIGTVTPLTNAGSIASYPGGMEQDCSRAEAERIDDLAASVNRGLTADLPVGVGFCLYLRRDCLTEVGLFDAKTFASGYGEEVDFCSRAATWGWRHVLAADVFIWHAGSRSFGRRRAALLERSKRIIDLRYPDFQKRVENFQGSGALVSLRRRLDEVRLRASSGRYVILLTLALTGGVERFVRERCDALRAAGLRPLILKPSEEGMSGCVLSLEDGVPNDLRYNLPDEISAVSDLLARLSIAGIELHHFLDLDARLVDAVIGLSAAVDIYIHDYSWICPRITLIDGTHRYCGEPALAACEVCIAKNGSSLNEPITVAELRARSGRWLAQARNVIVPTRDAAQRLARYFPDLRVKITPWESGIEVQTMARTPTDKVRVALIGAIGIHKGYKLLQDCAQDAAARNLPLEFIVLGYTENDEALIETGKVFVSGRYDEAELPELLTRESPDVVFFPAVWPEIWCYALTHAVRAGRPIVSFGLGALGERLYNYEYCVKIPLTDDPIILNDALLKTSRESDDALSSRDAAAEPETLRVSSREVVSQAEPRSCLMPALNAVSATVQILPVSDGLYAFSVRDGAPSRAEALDNILLPAVHVGLGPGVSSELVQFLADPKTHGSWLCEAGDIVVAKVSGSVTILLTSLQSANGQALAIDVEKLDRRARLTDVVKEQPTDPAKGVVTKVVPTIVTATAPALQVPLQIKLHVRNQGDASFLDAEWAGRVGMGKWIEAFSLVPLKRLVATDIEYKGLTATGLETPWLNNGTECGTRGKATPLVGFAVRLRQNGTLPHFDCEYSGYFSSGTIVGPLKNGAPCRSTLKNDPLEGVQIRITELVDAPVPADQPAAKAPAAIGPRFSKLREDEDEKEPAAARKPGKPARKSSPVAGKPEPHAKKTHETRPTAKAFPATQKPGKPQTGVAAERKE